MFENSVVERDLSGRKHPIRKGVGPLKKQMGLTRLGWLRLEELAGKVRVGLR